MSDDKTDFDISPPADGGNGNGNGNGELKSNPAFDNLSPALTEEDLKSPAALRLLYQEKRRLERELIYAKKYEALYHKTDKKASVLDEKLKSARASSVLYSALLVGGGVLMTRGVNVWNGGSTEGIVMLVLGGILLGVALFIQYFKE